MSWSIHLYATMAAESQWDLWAEVETGIASKQQWQQPGIDYLPIGFNHFCSDQATCVFLPYFDFYLLKSSMPFSHPCKASKCVTSANSGSLKLGAWLSQKALADPTWLQKLYDAKRLRWNPHQAISRRSKASIVLCVLWNNQYIQAWIITFQCMIE